MEILCWRMQFARTRPLAHTQFPAQILILRPRGLRLFPYMVTRPFRIAFNNVSGEDVAMMNF